MFGRNRQTVTYETPHDGVPAPDEAHLDALDGDVRDLPEPVEPEALVDDVTLAAASLTPDEVAGWRSAILHAGHGAHVPADLRPVLSVAFRDDLPALVTLARTRPDRCGDVRVGAPSGAERGSAWDRQHATSGVTRFDRVEGREVRA